MGFRLNVAPDPDTGFWSLRLQVELSRVESNALFLSGDTILAWPAEGLQQVGEPNDAAGPERTTMFVSEVAARPSGLRILYSSRAQAERTSALMRAQLAKTAVREEG